MNSTGLRAPALLLAAAAAVAGCGETVRELEPLRVNARSGAVVDLSRTTWENCTDGVPTAGQSLRSRIVHGEDGIVTYSSETFGQPACAGTGSFGSISYIGSAEGARAVTWSGTKPDAAPGTPAFPDAPAATRVFLENQVSIAGEVFWVDDVSSPRVLFASPQNSPADPNDGFPTLISATGFREIQ